MFSPSRPRDEMQGNENEDDRTARTRTSTKFSRDQDHGGRRAQYWLLYSPIGIMLSSRKSTSTHRTYARRRMTSRVSTVLSSRQRCGPEKHGPTSHDKRQNQLGKSTAAANVIGSTISRQRKLTPTDIAMIAHRLLHGDLTLAPFVVRIHQRQASVRYVIGVVAPRVAPS